MEIYLKEGIKISRGRFVVLSLVATVIGMFLFFLCLLGVMSQWCEEGVPGNGADLSIL